MENPCPWTPPIFTIPSNSRIDNGKFYPGWAPEKVAWARNFLS